MIEHVSTCIPLQLPTPSLRESDHHHNQKNGTCESEMTPISCQFFCVPYKYKMRGESIWNIWTPIKWEPKLQNLNFIRRQKQRFARMTEKSLMMVMMVAMIIMMTIMVILMMIMTKMTKKHQMDSSTWLLAVLPLLSTERKILKISELKKDWKQQQKERSSQGGGVLKWNFMWKTRNSVCIPLEFKFPFLMRLRIWTFCWQKLLGWDRYHFTIKDICYTNSKTSPSWGPQPTARSSNWFLVDNCS